MSETIAPAEIKVRRITRAGKPGPWHVVAWSGSHPLSWCGSRMVGFNYRETATTVEQLLATAESFGQVCPKCVKAVKAGKQIAYRSR